MDLTQLTCDEKRELKAQIERFKRQWKLHQLGEYHRLTEAQSDIWFTAWQVNDTNASTVLVNVVVRAPKANAPVLSVKLRGLQSDAVYVDEQGVSYTGAALMNAGLVLPPMKGDYPALQILITNRAGINKTYAIENRPINRS